MKISKKQAELLAVEVFNTLKTKNDYKVDQSVVAIVKEYKKKRDGFIMEKGAAEKAIEECDVSFRKKVGCVAKNIRGYWDEDNIIEKIKEANTPSLSDIENKIILNAMFASGDDLASFVSRITNEFLKGKKQKVLVD